MTARAEPLTPESSTGVFQRRWRELSAQPGALRPVSIAVDQRINAFGLSPSGARAVIEARGEIFTLPSAKGDVRNLTNTSGARELWPAWSPDGKSIASRDGGQN